MREVRAMNRAGRINQIKLAILEYHRRSQNPYMTAYEIANSIGMRPQSPAYRNHLKAAVEGGHIAVTEGVSAKKGVCGGKVFLYSLSEGEKPSPKKVPVKSKGVLIGQLELF